MFFLKTKVYCLIIAVAVIKVGVFYIPQILLFEEMGNFWIVPLKVLSDENQGGSKLVSIDSFCFTV